MYIEKVQIKKKNKIAQIHPVIKLWIVLIYCCTSLILGTIKEPFGGYSVLMYAFFLIPLILSLISGIGRKFVKIISTILIVILMIIIVDSLVLKSGGAGGGGGIIVRWNISEKFHPTIWEYGLQTGLKLGSSILNCAGIFAWLFQSTENKELSRALEEYNLNRKVVFMFLSSLQMIKVLTAKMEVIMNAQRARGVETSGNVFVRIRAFIPAIIPLVVGALADTEERSITMESKGFNYPGKKTHILELEKSGWERPCLAVFITFLVLSIIGRIVL